MKIIFKLGGFMRSKYNTNNKLNIMNYINKYSGSFSAQELYNEMVNCGENIGLTTIYRYLDELVSKNKLVKTYNEKNVAVYQLLVECNHENHFYLKCESCEKIIHVDCECIETLSNHLMKHHNFLIDKNNLFISGLCNDCRDK